VLEPGFEPGIGDDVEAEGIVIELRRLAGIPHKEPHMVDSPQR
jgi:hypothetical protein